MIYVPFHTVSVLLLHPFVPPTYKEGCSLILTNYMAHQILVSFHYQVPIWKWQRMMEKDFYTVNGVALTEQKLCKMMSPTYLR